MKKGIAVILAVILIITVLIAHYRGKMDQLRAQLAETQK